MKSIKITTEQAAILDCGDQRKSDPVSAALLKQAQALADETRQTIEIYHPEGYVWDSREPQS